MTQPPRAQENESMPLLPKPEHSLATSFPPCAFFAPEIKERRGQKSRRKKWVLCSKEQLCHKQVLFECSSCWWGDKMGQGDLQSSLREECRTRLSSAALPQELQQTHSNWHPDTGDFHWLETFQSATKGLREGQPPPSAAAKDPPPFPSPLLPCHA